jgi:hypothetical protein
VELLLSIGRGLAGVVLVGDPTPMSAP